jgi:amidase
MANELWRSSAVELARRIAGREVTARAVVEAHLERIAQVNPTLNAVTVVLADDALAAAQRADRAVAAGDALGPLHGVPFTVKENIDLTGSATTQGLPALAQAMPAIDAPVVERLRRAGAIPLARTNLPDLGLRVHTESALHGLTRNPWDATRTAGGSSGGEAAAIACGMSPLGLGNDIGGSLRNPAHCCGIASLKPSSGRVPHASALPPEDPSLSAQLMFVEGPMARHVEDLRVALAVLAGPHPRDPFVIAAPLAGPLGEDRPRVALMEAPPGAPTQPGVRAAVRRAADALADAGFAVDVATPPLFERVLEVWGGWLINELRPMLPLFSGVMGPSALAFLTMTGERFPEIDVAALAQLLVERHRIAREWAHFQERRPLLLSPVWTETAFPHGSDVVDADAVAATFELIRCVLPANLLGLPAAVVPAAVVDGLPVGVQITGPRLREDLCLDAAAVVEAALGRLTPIDPVR